MAVPARSTRWTARGQQSSDWRDRPGGGVTKQDDHHGKTGRLQRDFQKVFCARATRGFSCPSTAASGYLSIMALGIAFLLGPFLPIALPDAACLRAALARDVISDTTFCTPL